MLLMVTLAMQKNILVLGLSSPVPPQQQQQLTWQELGTTLVTMRANGVPEDVLRGTRLPSLSLSRCRVSDSKVLKAGKGLFASMDCKQGDLLTCYPGDVLMRQTGFTPNPKKDLGLDDATLRELFATLLHWTHRGHCNHGATDFGSRHSLCRSLYQ